MIGALRSQAGLDGGQSSKRPGLTMRLQGFEQPVQPRCGQPLLVSFSELADGGQWFEIGGLLVFPGDDRKAHFGLVENCALQQAHLLQ